MPIGFGVALDFWSDTRPLNALLEDYAEILELAEKLGFNSVWAGENRFRAPEAGHVPSPLLVLSALAPMTRLQLGTGVILVPIRHPLQLAYDGALLDQLSGGRLILGVGVGNPPLIRRYGFPSDETSPRMDEALLLLKKLWSGAGEFQGRHFQVKGGVYPGPVQPGGPPIWVGGKIRRAIQRAVDLGDGWYGGTQFNFAAIKRLAHLYRQLLTEKGRNPSDGTVAINRTTFLADSDTRARKEGKPYLNQVLNFYGKVGLIQDAQGSSLDPGDDLFEAAAEDHCFVGSPETCAAAIQRYRDEAGVDQFNLRISMANMPTGLIKQSLTLLGEQVLPRFR